MIVYDRNRKDIYKWRISAVRLPKTCRFEGTEVLVNKIGDIVILMPKDDPWAAIMSSRSMFTDDFMKEEIEDFTV